MYSLVAVSYILVVLGFKFISLGSLTLVFGAVFNLFYIFFKN